MPPHPQNGPGRGTHSDEDDRARTGVGAGGAAARAPHTIVLGAAAELLAAGASADGDEAGDEAERSQALAGLRHSELLRRASKGQLGAATEANESCARPCTVKYTCGDLKGQGVSWSSPTTTARGRVSATSSSGI